MDYFDKNRRLGDSSVLYDNLGTAPTTYGAWLSDPLGALSATENDLNSLKFINATGNLPSSAYQTIQNQTNQAIAAAAPGDPALVAQEQAQSQAELQQVAAGNYYGGAGNLYADLGVAQDTQDPPWLERQV